jgi:hypothetical protein
MDRVYPKGLVIQYDKIASNKDLMPLTRILALKLKDQQYITMKGFFEMLSNADLAQLCDYVNTVNVGSEDKHKAAYQMVLLTEMLTRAEGCVCSSHEELNRYLSKFMSLVATASLERQGLICVHWENASLGDEYDDKPLAYMPPQK